MQIKYLRCFDKSVILTRFKSRSHGLVVKAGDLEPTGSGFKPLRQILDGCCVDCFTQHNPPATLN